MDRNSLIGIVLITLLVMGMLYYNADQAPPPKPATAAADSTRQNAPAPPADQPAQATVKVQQQPTAADTNATLQSQYGSFAPAARGQQQRLVVRTERLQLELSTRGGGITHVTLPEYRTYDSLPLPTFISGNGNEMDIAFRHGNRTIRTSELYFVPSSTTEINLKGDAKQTLTLRATVAPGKYMEQSYTFVGNRYDVGYSLRMVGMGDLIHNNNVDLLAQYAQPRTEKNYETQTMETTLVYGYEEGEPKDDGDHIVVERLDPATKDPIPSQSYGGAKWVSFKSHFFCTALIADKKFEDISLEQAHLNYPTEATALKRMKAIVKLPYTHAPDEQTSWRYYFGPNQRSELLSYKIGMEKQMNYGWWITKYINIGIVLPIFKLLESFNWGYGIIIFCLAVVIKLITLPMTYRSSVSNARMQVVNSLPEMKQLEDRYADDPTKLQTQKMAFYNSVGVSPLAGCVPLLLQLPILIALFSFFPQCIELRQQGFLWANDLSTYDSIVNFGFSLPLLGAHLSGFALLMTISQIAITYVTQQGQAMSGPAAQMKFLGYVMPVIFFFVLNSYSAGLSYYYLCINILSIGQTYGIKAFIDEEKIKEKIHATRAAKGKAGAKPTGGIAGWLEKQQKKQEQMLRERREATRKGGKR